MKKTCVLLLVFVFLTGSLFAADNYAPTETAYKLTGTPYRTTSTRLNGMGGSGLGVSGYSDSFVVNPANLGDGKFSLTIPSITVTMFNPQSLLSGNFFPDFQNAMNTKASGDYVTAVGDLLATLSKGQNEIERIDAGFSFTAGPVGLSVQTQQKAFGYLSSSDYMDGKYLIEASAAVTLGLGFRIPIGRNSDWSVDVGAHGQFVYKMYSQALDYANVINIVTSDNPFNMLKSSVTMMSGYAIPITIGANLNMPLGFKLSAVGRNINGKYKYTVNNSLDDYMSNNGIKHIFDAKTDFTYDDGFSLDAGVTWKPELSDGIAKFIQPTLSVDVLDMTNFSASQPFLAHLYAGAQVRLFSFLDVRYGIAKGYQSLGVGFDLLIFHIDASYWRTEYGTNFLDKSSDALSIKFSLGTK